MVRAELTSTRGVGRDTNNSNSTSFTLLRVIRIQLCM